jgi:hypothetical protein
MMMTQTKADVLAEPLAGLEQALRLEFPGHEREWAEEVGGTLAHVHQALRLHAASAEGPDGLFVKVDLTRPTLARQAGELRRQHRELFEQACSLEKELRIAAQVFQPSGDAAVSTPVLPEPATASAVPDFGLLRQNTQGLLTALQHHVEDEAKLILDSVNTDIGVGD